MDKSKFLSIAGYSLLNWQQLEKDIRKLIASNEAIETAVNIYGNTYEVKGILQGPNGENLFVSMEQTTAT